MNAIDLKDKRIFIVEDNITNRVITQMLLERHGAIIGHDRWGIEAISRLKQFAPVELILLDLMLGNNLTGYDVFDQIRALPEFSHVPIVAVSASDAATAIPETQEKGFFGFISKPIDYHQFPAQISKILQGEHLWYSPTHF